MIRFTCPACKRPMSAARDAAGRTGACTNCGQPVTVPLASSVAAPDADPPRRGVARLVLWWLALVLMAVPLCIAVVIALGPEYGEGVLPQMRRLLVMATLIVGVYCLARALDRLLS